MAQGKNTKDARSALGSVSAPVVALGASAGGLQALSEFFDEMPADSGIAFVVVTHQHPDGQSLLPELLAKHTQMSVAVANNGDHLQANHILVSPAGVGMEVFHGALQLLDSPAVTSPSLPIDLFFRSLALDLKHNAIGIILSGTGSDGTLGVRAIKGELGMVIAQDPESAEYDGMPQSAIKTGIVDFVLSAAQMPSQLMAFVLKGSISKLGNSELESALPKVFSQLRKRTGHDFSLYKQNTVRRRIRRRMSVHQIGSPTLYVTFIQNNPYEIDQLFNELLITVTNFFRDPEAFEALAVQVRKRVESIPENGVFRVWVAGCATGEEAYSVAIVVHEALSDLRKNLSVQVFATDLDSNAIEVARVGRYPDGIAADVNEDRLQRYFNKDEDSYYIVKYIREMVVFAPQNMIKDPPFTKLDLISCRNVLIYLNSDLQKSLLPVFHYSLLPGGLLFLGSSETVGLAQDLFIVEDKKAKLYRRKESLTDGRVEFPIQIGRQEALVSSALVPPSVPITSNSGVLLLKELLLKALVPPTVIVNERGDIIHVHGKTGQYLELPSGRLSSNIIEMAREGLQLDLAAAIRHAKYSDQPIVHHNVIVKSRDPLTDVENTDLAISEVDIRVQKITDPDPIRGLVLVTFLPSLSNNLETPVEIVGDESHQESDRFAKLELELRYMQETLRNAVLQSDTANEDLKSTNEELQSANEELQSANEELETSKEEMQSLNEELHTVNAELSTKLDELSHSNDDMQNLLNSTEIATLFLDNKIQIKRFAKSATNIFKIRDVDVGRSLSEVVHNLNYDELIQDASSVLETLVYVEKEIRTQSGDKAFRVRILPYRTSDNMIDGLVITLVDIKEMQDARDYAENIIATLSEPWLVVGSGLRIVSTNSGFYSLFQLKDVVLEGSHLVKTGFSNDDINRIKTLIDNIARNLSLVDEFEFTYKISESESKLVLISGRLLMQTHDSRQLVLLTFKEIY